MAVRAKRKRFQKGDTVRLIGGKQTAKVSDVGPFRDVKKGVVLQSELNGSRYYPATALEYAQESTPVAKAA